MELDAATAERTLAETLIARGVVPTGAPWRRLRGGRSNLVWSVPVSGGARICKLYDAEAQTPLFPNDPLAERTALASLAGTGLAPRMRDAGGCPAGLYLVYDAVPGDMWSDDPTCVTRRLAALHARDPAAGLRRAPLRAEEIRTSGLAMLERSGRDDLASVRPEAPPRTDAAPVFLHGDPVPSNVLRDGRSGRITFVDWQCPAAGDPVLDLAVFLSPSMQIASGRPPLTERAVEDALAAYGDDGVARRFRAWRPLLTWRFACYAAWKVARGDPDYGDGLSAERALLERLQNEDHDGGGGAARPG